MLIKLFAGFILFAALSSAAQQNVSPPQLAKDVKKLLDKNGKNAQKGCEADPSIKPNVVADRCLDYAWALRRQAKDPTDATTALRRSCALGNPEGCNQFGLDLDAAGNHSDALATWQLNACANSDACQVSLINSVTNHSPVDMDLLTKVGWPVCVNGNDSVCQVLAAQGIPGDYAQITSDNRVRAIQNLQERIQSADQLAQTDEQSASDAEQNQATSAQPTGMLGALSGALSTASITTMRAMAAKQRALADSLRQQLQDLQSKPLDIPQVASSSTNP